jgi:hypothetical protein
VVASKSTGRAGYRLDTTDLTKDENVQWFDSLYDLFRVIEIAAEEGRVTVRNGYGQPWQIVEEVGQGMILYVDEYDESEEEDDDDDKGEGNE